MTTQPSGGRKCDGARREYTPRLYISTEAREGETDAQWRSRTGKEFARGMIGFTHPMGIVRSKKIQPEAYVDGAGI